jgi:hypothetical protein
VVQNQIDFILAFEQPLPRRGVNLEPLAQAVIVADLRAFEVDGD